MSDFWAKKLGTPPQQRPEPVPAAPSHAWWDQPTGRAQTPEQQPVASQQPAPAAPGAHAPQVPAKAMSAQQHGQCPNCASGNFFRPPGNPNAAERCLECGYPNLHQLSGASLPSGRTGEATPTRQIPTDGYNPGVIVGRIT